MEELLPACLNCNTELQNKRTDYGQIEYCPNCQSKLIGAANVKRSDVKYDIYHQLWTKAKQDEIKTGRGCPLCNDNMSLQKVQSDDHEIKVEICTHCFQLWFDTGEFENLPRNEIKQLIAEQDPRIRRVLSNYERLTEAEQKKEKFKKTSMRPKSFWEYVAGVFGFPIEEEGSFFEFYPYITWTFTILCFVTFFMTVGELRNYVMQLGFIPSQWTKYFGLTVVTSLIMHGSLWHVISNMYFLLAFGDNVEDHLGRFKYVLLLIGSHAMGLLLHGFFDPSTNIPLIGASAAVSGVMAFYAATFPNKKIAVITVCLIFQFLLIIFISNSLPNNSLTLF